MSSEATSEGPVRARQFVDAHGCDLDRAVMTVVFGAAAPTHVADVAVAESLDAIEKLHALLLVGLGAHPLVEALVADLERDQAPDGSFGDTTLDLESRLARTGEFAGALARTPFARRSTLDRAAAFMAEHWSVERVQGPTYTPILAYFELLASHPTDLADEALQWCGRELERGFRTGAFDAARVARVFVRCAARSLPGTPLGVGELAPALATAQAEDGGFGAPGASARERVAVTVDALVAWVGAGE